MKSKSVSGKKYSAVEERFNRKKLEKEEKSMNTAGISNALKKSRKDMGKAKLVKVKPQKKC